ncbi:MOSC domain-containing protein [Streptomyces sp. NPDC088116]|uniref:MOSC domain-containing protein n=1 Tax=Streptomyces sp. NPDC088116 TaxID=3365825 RepID=UPI003830CE16
MPKSAHPALHAVRFYPVKSMAGCASDSAVVEPWGLAGDRRWTLIDAAGKAVTQRQQPRLALVRAEPLPDGGIRLHAPGLEPLTVTVPDPAAGGTVVVDIFGTKVESVHAGHGSNHAHDDPRHGDGEERAGFGQGLESQERESQDPDARDADRRLSAYLGVEVRLAHLDDPARRRPIDPLYAHPGETVSFADGFPLLVTTTASLDALNSLVSQGDQSQEGPLSMDRFRPNLVVAGTTPWAEDDWQRIAVGDLTFRVAKPCGRCVITTTDQRTAERGKEPLRTLGRYRRFGGQLLFGQNLVPESTGTVRVGDPVTVLD